MRRRDPVTTRTAPDFAPMATTSGSLVPVSPRPKRPACTLSRYTEDMPEIAANESEKVFAKVVYSAGASGLTKKGSTAMPFAEKLSHASNATRQTMVRYCIKLFLYPLSSCILSSTKIVSEKPRSKVRGIFPSHGKVERPDNLSGYAQTDQTSETHGNSGEN